MNNENFKQKISKITTDLDFQNKVLEIATQYKNKIGKSAKRPFLTT